MPTKGYLRLLAVNALVLVVILLVVEGLSSYVLFVRLVGRTAPAAPLAERQHTEYDPELGWVNKPNVSIPDMYGPGISLRTNGQRFRNNQDVGKAPPSGQQRIICSGDSFTLGYGVDNDQTWCHLLTSLDPGLETVNMGQGGYGVDQAYLWFKREEPKFDRRIHILAFITSDFYRMQSTSFWGYGKPVIAIEGSALVVRNVPVPERSSAPRWLTSGIDNLRSLRTLLVLDGLTARIRSTRPATERNAGTREVLKKLFEDLKCLNEARASQLVLVYLPTIYELKGDAPLEWTQFVDEQSRALNIPFINAFNTFRRLPLESIDGLFIPEGQVDYPGAAGHLSQQGNAVMAQAIYERIKPLLVP